MEHDAHVTSWFKWVRYTNDPSPFNFLAYCLRNRHPPSPHPIPNNLRSFDLTPAFVSPEDETTVKIKPSAMEDLVWGMNDLTIESDDVTRPNGVPIPVVDTSSFRYLSSLLCRCGAICDGTDPAHLRVSTDGTLRILRCPMCPR